jgi:hypothetical protein
MAKNRSQDGGKGYITPQIITGIRLVGWCR